MDSYEFLLDSLLDSIKSDSGYKRTVGENEPAPVEEAKSEDIITELQPEETTDFPSFAEETAAEPDLSGSPSSVETGEAILIEAEAEPGSASDMTQVPEAVEHYAPVEEPSGVFENDVEVPAADNAEQEETEPYAVFANEPAPAEPVTEPQTEEYIYVDNEVPAADNAEQEEAEPYAVSVDESAPTEPVTEPQTEEYIYVDNEVPTADNEEQEEAESYVASVDEPAPAEPVAEPQSDEYIYDDDEDDDDDDGPMRFDSFRNPPTMSGPAVSAEIEALLAGFAAGATKAKAADVYGSSQQTEEPAAPVTDDTRNDISAPTAETAVDEEPEDDTQPETVTENNVEPEPIFTEKAEPFNDTDLSGIIGKNASDIVDQLFGETEEAMKTAPIAGKTDEDALEMSIDIDVSDIFPELIDDLAIPDDTDDDENEEQSDQEEPDYQEEQKEQIAEAELYDEVVSFDISHDEADEEDATGNDTDIETEDEIGEDADAEEEDVDTEKNDTDLIFESEENQDFDDGNNNDAVRIAGASKSAKDEQPPQDAVDGSTRLYERPGFVRAQSLFGKTGDLTEVPSIMAADTAATGGFEAVTKDFEVRNVDAEKKKEPAENAQLILPGFGEKDEPKEISNEELNNEVTDNRNRQVDKFMQKGLEIDEPVLDPQGEEELHAIEQDGRNEEKLLSARKLRLRLEKPPVEYNRPRERGAVSKHIALKKLISLIGMGVTAISTLVLFITVGFSGVAEKLGYTAGNVPVRNIVSLVFILISFAAGCACLYDGVTALLKGNGRPNTRTPILAAGLTAIVHNIIVLIINDAPETDTLYTPAASFVLLLGCIGSYLVYSRIQNNFIFLLKRGKDGIHTVRAADGQTDASHPGQESVIDEPGLRYSGRTRFAAKFMSYSLAADSTDDLCVKLLPGAAGVALLFAVIMGIVDGSIHSALNAFACAVCTCLPASALLAVAFPLFNIDSRMSRDGAVITSYAAAYEYESTNSIVVDAGDIFPADTCSLNGMKPFNGVRIDDAVLTAASMLIKAGGSISHLFNEVIMGRQDLLMSVDDLVYEDRLGLSGWIRGRRIFLGNRKLLENHGISIPITFDEKPYRKDNRRVLYLADSGKLAAIFVVSYGVNSRIADYLSRIDAVGITIVVKTIDSNITEDFVAKAFGLPVNNVRVVSSNVREVLTNLSEVPVDREDAQIIHNGSALAYLRAVSSAILLNDISGLVNTLIIIGCFLGLFIMIMFYAFKGGLDPKTVILCHLLWAAVCLAVPKLSKD